MTDYKLPCWFALSGANYTNGSVANCPVNDEIMQELSDEFLTVSSFINSDRFKEQRLKLQRGEWPQGCESCRVREQNGTPSHRQGELARFNSSNYWSDFLKIKTEDIIRTRIEKYKNIYFLARSLKRKLS